MIPLLAQPIVQHIFHVSPFQRCRNTAQDEDNAVALLHTWLQGRSSPQPLHLSYILVELPLLTESPFAFQHQGGDDTFGTFPEHLRALVSHALPEVDVVTLTYPKFETRGDLMECVGRFREWYLSYDFSPSPQRAIERHHSQLKPQRTGYRTRSLISRSRTARLRLPLLRRCGRYWWGIPWGILHSRLPRPPHPSSYLE